MKELPFSIFYDLIEAAERAENEKTLFPFFVCGWAVARIRGEQPPSFEEFMRATMPEPSGGDAGSENRASPEEEAAAIMKEFAPIIAAEKEREERRG